MSRLLLFLLLTAYFSKISQIIFMAAFCDFLSLTAIKIVSSPAIVPMISVIFARSMRTQIADAKPLPHLATIKFSPAASILNKPKSCFVSACGNE